MSYTYPHPSLTSLYRFGEPIKTRAVIANLPVQVDNLSLPFTTIERSDGKIKFTLTLNETDAVFGLGQVLGTLNRRGKHFRLFNRDDPLHIPDKPGLYGAHPFLFIDGQDLAFFFDVAAEINFDVGYNKFDELEIVVDSTGLDLYLWKTGTIRSATKELMCLIGAPVMPPRWSFGYQQCRYSYPDEKTVREVAHNLRANGLPCDAIYLDIDYMKDYKVFTFDEGRFPDPKGLVDDMRQMGFKLIPIVDPGIRIDEGFEPYETGLAAEVYCKNLDGKPFIGAVWPGLTHFPDFQKAQTREWWTKCHTEFIEMGFEHYWNDMNEPAIFYTKERLAQISEVAKDLPADLDLRTQPFEYLERLSGFLGAEHYYDEFTQEVDGKETAHRAVHNLYGASMVRATKQALDHHLPGKRHFILTRSSYMGTHRDCVMWTGDNHSWWEHMLAHMRMLQGMNMVGFFFCGADTGGFSANASPELVVRWLQLGVFSPLFRNHSAKNTRGQEPWMFGEGPLKIMKASLELRSALQTYLYSEYIHSLETATPFVTGLMYHYFDEHSKTIEDQFFVGQTLMACPIHQSNARSRFIHLPGDRPWLIWKPRHWDDFTFEIMEPGQHLVDVALDQTCIALAEDTLMPVHAPRQHDGEPFPETITFFGLVNKDAMITLSGDDGENENSARWTLTIEVALNAMTVNITGIGCPFKKFVTRIYDEDGSHVEVSTTVDEKLPDGTAL